MSLKYNDNAHRYWLDGKPVKGATTLMNGGIPKPALVPWAAKKVAEYVDANPREVERLRNDPDKDFVRELMKAPNEVRDKAALRGTEIHDLGQRYLDGEDIGEEMGVHEPEVMGLVDFIEDMELEPMIVEKSLGNRKHWYAGRVDFIGTSPHLHGGRPVLVDWKTSNRVYGDTALQCAAYAKAEFWVSDDDPKTEYKMPNIVATYVAHISAIGVKLHPLATSRKQIDQHLEDFLAAAKTAKQTEARKKYLGEPIWTPEMKGKQ